ncbi:MAG: hypothetical protein WBD51_18455, partial [Burkholderiaceae bacterium]
ALAIVLSVDMILRVLKSIESGVYIAGVRQPTRSENRYCASKPLPQDDRTGNYVSFVARPSTVSHGIIGQ